MSGDVWHRPLEPQDSLLRSSKGAAPLLPSASDPGPHLGFEIPLYPALGMSPPSDTITRVFNHMLLRPWPTPLLSGLLCNPTPNLHSCLPQVSLLDCSGAQGALWTVAIRLSASGFKGRRPSPAQPPIGQLIKPWFIILSLNSMRWSDWGI